MGIFKYFKLAWRNIWRNKRRTIIALIAIVIGLILLVFTDGLYGNIIQVTYGNAVRLYGGNVQVHAPGYRAKANRLPLLPIENADQVVQIAGAHPEVLLASKRINTGGMINARGETYPVAITAIQPSVEEPTSLIAETIVAGRFLHDDDQDMVLISSTLADEMEAGVGDRITMAGRSKNETMRQRTMTIAGIFNLGMGDAEEGLVFISLAEAGDLYNLRDQATEVTIALHTVGTEDQVISDLQSDLQGYEVDSWLTLNPGLTSSMAMSRQMASVFGFVLISIACIGILNLMMMAVYERTREMGVLAALGLKGRQIMGLFLLEGAVIGLVGAAIGCTLGWLAILAFNAAGGYDMTAYSDMGEVYALMGDAMYASVDPLGIVQQGVIVVAMTTLAALIPSWQASRKEPAEALHHL